MIDLTTRELLYEELVAHGQGSGGATATMFSNEPETHRTSLGLFKTDDTYVGKNGYSLRLDGLDEGHQRPGARARHRDARRALRQRRSSCAPTAGSAAAGAARRFATTSPKR